jgi:antitoxin (DNA-binding transcriptional repressor) of toxin-antitoxin stability system
MSVQTIGVYEAKTHLPQFLRQVPVGQTFDISVRGVTVARLVPIAESDERRVNAVSMMREFTRQQSEACIGDGVNLAELIAEGRACALSWPTR